MSLNYELRRDKHAIGEFTATLLFFQPVGAATFSAVVNKLRELAPGLNLPAQMPIQVFQFTLGDPPPGMKPPAPPPTGVGFQRFSTDGEVAASLICDANSITLVLREYTVWQEVKPQIVDVFSTLAEQYISEVPAIQSVRVQYLNELRASSKDVRSAKEIFRPGSKWLAPFVFESEEPWHCHSGFYIPVDANQRRLVNINCDVSPAAFPPLSEERTYTKVLIMAGCFYNVPGGQPLVVGVDDLRQALDDNFEAAHDLEKAMLRELIADPYLEAIGALDAH